MTQNEINQKIEKIERKIETNKAFIKCLGAIRETADGMDGKVFNKRFTDVLKENSREFNIYGYSKRPNNIEIVINLRTDCPVNYYENTRHFQFSYADCFSVSENGTIRIKADGFKDRCSFLTKQFVSENAELRNGISAVYNMLREYEALKNQINDYNKRYNNVVMREFDCLCRLQSY